MLRQIWVYLFILIIDQGRHLISHADQDYIERNNLEIGLFFIH